MYRAMHAKLQEESRLFQAGVVSATAGADGDGDDDAGGSGGGGSGGGVDRQGGLPRASKSWPESSSPQPPRSAAAGGRRRQSVLSLHPATPLRGGGRLVGGMAVVDAEAER